jgi:transcriptional regulator with XRE-family HTH domain
LATGEILRRARHRSGLTLHQVMTRSGGRFKPSVIGGYERGERSISLSRFWELSRFYGVPPDRLLGEVLAELAPESRTEVVIDVNKLTLVLGDEGRAVAEFVHRVKMQRGDYLTDVITLRSGDLEALSLATGESPPSLLRKLRPALRQEPHAEQ